MRFFIFLLVLFLVQTAPASPDPESPAPVQSPAWGLTTSGDPDLETGWSSTKPAEYRFTDNGVELVLCYHWGCSETANYTWSLSHLSSISRKIASCATSAENELLAIRNAIRDTEREIMKKLEYLSGDIAGNRMDEDRWGRLDCVDNSSNTNTLLRILQDHEPFKYWKVYKPQRDGITKPHLSASVRTEDPDFIAKYRDKTRMGNRDYTVWVVDAWLTTFALKPILYEARDWKYKLDPWGKGPYNELYEKKLQCWH